MKKHYLLKVFEPTSVAVIGASDRESSVGGQALLDWADTNGFGFSAVASLGATAEVVQVRRHL